jgi:hypothetical protein
MSIICFGPIEPIVVSEWVQIKTADLGVSRKAQVTTLAPKGESTPRLATKPAMMSRRETNSSGLAFQTPNKVQAHTANMNATVKVKTKQLSKRDKEIEISNLLFKHTKRHGAGLQTARAILAELKKHNHVWQITDLQDIQRGIEQGVKRLSYFEQTNWAWHKSALRDFEALEVRPYLESLALKPEPAAEFASPA